MDKKEMSKLAEEKGAAGKGLLLWLIGVPLPVIILLWLTGLLGS